MKFKLGKRLDSKGVHVAVQGVGHVGYHLCKELHAAGAQAHRRRRRPAQGRARAARVRRQRSSTLDEILEVECDVFAPCALGARAQRRTPSRSSRRRSSPAPRTTSSPSRATATTSTRAASSTRPTTRSTPAASSTSPRSTPATTRRSAREKTLRDLRHDHEIIERSRREKTQPEVIADRMARRDHRRRPEVVQ